MNVKVEQFCSLATSPSWQAWLYHHSNIIYKEFIRRLQGSRNCTENRELMKDILKSIDEDGGAESLEDFLKSHYPHMLQGNSLHIERVSEDKHGVFPGYSPGILTYPHRVIFEGNPEKLEKRVKNFITKKGHADHIILGNRAYIEYLENSESDLVGKIPEKNWQIAIYRKDNT